ncbi:6,7-dimethyl-8-ribityllumazine synthase [Tropheryma whipplei]|uniref:6,7-dimethyl-8-ribityllumazine synthase n=1 Tax=Tropheryma whipplei TaxID=2039 RepID=UPI0004B46D4F|nr:6,7-dimethyl-8-ribityllumazine synthase [Tropheryma whipplei]
MGKDRNLSLNSPESIQSVIGDTDIKIAVIAAMWHEKIVRGLIDGATREIVSSGSHAELFRVPGSVELVLACKKLLKTFDAAVALGVILRGETDHNTHIARLVLNGITDVMLALEKPIGIGVLTIDTEQQGLDRSSGDYNAGVNAARAVIRMVRLFR